VLPFSIAACCKTYGDISLYFKVLDLVTYEARQRDYASRGQKHFYFMTLNGGEVWPAPFTFDYTVVADYSVLLMFLYSLSTYFTYLKCIALSFVGTVMK